MCRPRYRISKDVQSSEVIKCKDNYIRLSALILRDSTSFFIHCTDINWYAAV